MTTEKEYQSIALTELHREVGPTEAIRLVQINEDGPLGIIDYGPKLLSEPNRWGHSYVVTFALNPCPCCEGLPERANQEHWWTYGVNSESASLYAN